MRQISIVTAVVIFIASACSPKGAEDAPAPSTTLEIVSTETPTAEVSAGTPYPTVPPTEPPEASFLQRSLALPEGSGPVGSDEHPTSDWLPAAGFADALLGMKAYFSEGAQEAIEGQGRMTAAIYRTESAARSAFQSWDAATNGNLFQGGRVPSRTADEFIFRFFPPIPTSKKGETRYRGTTYLYLRRCRLILTIDYDDYTAGDVPVDAGDPALRMGTYLKARDPLESSFLDSLDRTQAALEEVACSQDVMAALVQSGVNVSATPASSDSTVRLLASVLAGSADLRTIMGELANDGPRPVLGIQVYAVFLDSNGRRVGAATSFSNRPIVRPGERDSFTMYPDPKIPDWKTYRVEVVHYAEVDDISDYTDQLELSVETFEPEHFTMGNGDLVEGVLEGTIENTSGRALEYVSVVALLYGDDDQFVGTADEWLTTSEGKELVLEPGETVPFGLEFWNLPAEAARHELYADASIVSP